MPTLANPRPRPSECWNQQLSELCHVQFLLFLDCPAAVMTARLLERGKTSGRSDDNEESIRKRLVTYENSTRPIIEYFRSIGKVREVDSHRPPDDVYAEVAVHFNNAAHAT